jgi:hypothetical protein
MYVVLTFAYANRNCMIKRTDGRIIIKSEILPLGQVQFRRIGDDALKNIQDAFRQIIDDMITDMIGSTVHYSSKIGNCMTSSCHEGTPTPKLITVQTEWVPVIPLTKRIWWCCGEHQPVESTKHFFNIDIHHLESLFSAILSYIQSSNVTFAQRRFSSS